MNLRRVRKGVGRALAAVAVAATALSIPSPAGALIDTTATALQLAQAMATDPSVITGASYVTKPVGGTSAAVANSASALAGFPVHGDDYAILSTGNAADADNAPQSNFASTDLGGGHVRGDTDNDVTILEVKFTVPPESNCATVGVFRFLSEEYPEWVGTAYNDAFIAELDTSTWSTSGSVISAPNNFAFDQSGDVVSINSTGATDMSAPEAAGTVYDGATEILSASTPVTPGDHSIFFSIFDQGDRIYDSAVFLDNFRLSSVTPGSCVPGAKAALTTSKTADSPVSGTGGTNGYTITISNPNNTPIQLNDIYDDLPAGFTYQAGSTTGVTVANPTISGQHLTWTGPFSVPASGSVSLHFRVTVSTTPGTYLNNAGGSAGTVNVTPANNVAPINVIAGTTTRAYPAVLDVNLPTTAYTYSLRATLTSTATGAPIPGKLINFTVGGTPVPCLNPATATTNTLGDATCLAVLSAAQITANFGYTATFPGDAVFTGSSDTATLTAVLGTPVI